MSGFADFMSQTLAEPQPVIVTVTETVDPTTPEELTLTRVLICLLILGVAYSLSLVAQPVRNWLQKSNHPMSNPLLHSAPVFWLLTWLIAIAAIFIILVQPGARSQIYVWSLLGLTLIVGLRQILSQTLAGVFVILQRRVRPGEAVRIGALRGRVERMSLQGVLLRSADGVLHMVPSLTVLNETVEHEEHYSARPVHIEVPLPKNLDPHKAARVLYEVAALSPYADARVRPEVAIELTDKGPSLSLWSRALSLEDERRYRSQVGVRVARELESMVLDLPDAQPA